MLELRRRRALTEGPRGKEGYNILKRVGHLTEFEA